MEGKNQFGFLWVLWWKAGPPNPPPLADDARGSAVVCWYRRGHALVGYPGRGGRSHRPESRDGDRNAVAEPSNKDGPVRCSCYGGGFRTNDKHSTYFPASCFWLPLYWERSGGRGGDRSRKQIKNVWKQMTSANLKRAGNGQRVNRRVRPRGMWWWLMGTFSAISVTKRQFNSIMKVCLCPSASLKL